MLRIKNNLLQTMSQKIIVLSRSCLMINNVYSRPIIKKPKRHADKNKEHNKFNKKQTKYKNQA